MVRFFYKIFVLSVLVFAFDLVVGNILRYFYFTQESGLLYGTTYSLERTTADILIFGSSRANHHYVPQVFEDGLKASCYNVGRDGTSILYHYAILKGIKKRYTPRIVILDFSSGEFSKTPDTYDKLCLLLPYYKTHEEVRSIIELRGPFEKIKLISQIYPFNSLIFTITVGNSEFNKRRYSDIKGYIPLYKKLNIPLEASAEKNKKAAIDMNKVNAFESFRVCDIKVGRFDFSLG